MKIQNYYEEKYEGKYEENRTTGDQDIINLFYAIMYRNWKAVKNYVVYNNCAWNEIKDEKFKEKDITIEKCFKYNMDFLKSNKNQVIYSELCEKLGNDFAELENDFDFYTYDDKRFLNGESVFDIFWDGNQPVLNLKYYEKQTLAAQQVMKNNCSMVLDEVGTGKTVAGIYTIQQIIQENLDSPQQIIQENLDSPKKKDTVKILIICP